MTPDDLANLRREAVDALANHPNDPDLNVVAVPCAGLIGMIDALAAEKAAHRHALDQQRAAFAKTLGEAETAAYMRAREDALTAINNAGDYAHRMEAERDEARAEIAALREIRSEQRNEPIEGWRNYPRGSACYDRMLAPERRLMTIGTLWQLFEGPEDEDEDGDGTEGLVCHGFSSERDTPTRGAMRAAEDAARARGWLP